MKKKTMVRKTLVMLLALCMVFTTVAGAFAASAASFTDINSGHWAYTYVDDCVRQELFSGTGNNTFSPEVSMTRGMFVTVLSNLHKASVNNNASSAFSDVETGQWYTGAVNWAANNNIVSGMDDGTFRPNEPVTREQMASMIVRYANFAKVTLKNNTAAVTFSDQASINSYALDAVKSCQTAGLISGMGDGTFAPQDQATRAQVAVIISKLAVLKNGSSSSAVTVTFDLNNKNAKGQPEEQVLYSGALVSKPSDPTLDGGTFLGWYTSKSGNTKWDFNDNVYSSMTLYAKWDTGSGGGGGGGGNGGGDSTYDIEFSFDDTATSKITEVKVAGTVATDGYKLAKQTSGHTIGYTVKIDDALNVYPRVKENGTPVQYDSKATDAAGMTTYTYSIKVSAKTTVAITTSSYLAEGVYNGDQAVFTEVNTTDVTINLPIQEMKANGKTSFTIYLDEAIAANGVTVKDAADPSAGDLAKYVKTTSQNGRAVTVNLDLSTFTTADLADFSTYAGLDDITVTTASGIVYNINIYASAVYNIEVADDVYEFTINEDPAFFVRTAGVYGSSTGRFVTYGSTTELCDIDFTLLYAKNRNKVPAMSISNKYDTDVAVKYDRADLTQSIPVGGVATDATKVFLKTDGSIGSYIYTIKVETVETADVSYDGKDLYVDQYDKFIFAYLPVDTLLDPTETASFKVTLPEAITGYKAINPATKDAFGVSYATNGKVATITMNNDPAAAVTRANFDSTTTWETADLELTTASGTYYVSVHASSVWHIDVECAQDATATPPTSNEVELFINGTSIKTYDANATFNAVTEVTEVMTVEATVDPGYTVDITVNGTSEVSETTGAGGTFSYTPSPQNSEVYNVKVVIKAL